ncbi:MULTISPECIES: hypothetical protein [Staphylococcus]|uniref:hypothetical protein n=1 Tax=Staphylococcus TaxID=1279 RepID=UPI00066C93CC|nr:MULTISPECIES: hypothetical protein [Staphylococcus]KAB2285225.1 hypothetical protein F9B70_04335 [Staphylococcus epidermidis]MDH8978028.1 hypothetical protein [Staphylococcus epidermidis]MDH8981605.1 hypothetical protein [Staphylococcus epidermidis]MDH8987299.1 hypothetical protein [Staphylococcus epidermidis]MDH8992326.1 hypothetical protein [Staphylococcus epidermidis]
MKNTKVKEILILVSIIIAIILFVFVVGYIISYFDPKHSITGYSIAISFIGVFATFGGAYLGAKISGENANNLSKKENMINDLRSTLHNNNRILDEFNYKGLPIDLELLLNTRSFSNVLDINNCHIKIMKLKSEYDYFVKTNNFENVFPLISYQFDILTHKLDDFQRYSFNIIDKINKQLHKILVQRGYKSFAVYGYDSGLSIYKDEGTNDIIVEIKYKNNLEKVKVDIREVNKAYNNKDIENINHSLIKARECWNNFQFKTKKDIRNYIAEYYGEYI